MTANIFTDKANLRPTGAVVLYVEDDDADRFFMERAFAKCEMRSSLQMIVDGLTAMECMAEGGNVEPDLLLLDLNLPGASGFDVLEWVRGQERLAGLPVVVFSSSENAEDKLRAQRLGADGYIVKPSSGLEFIRVVQGLKDRWLNIPVPACGTPMGARE